MRTIIYALLMSIATIYDVIQVLSYWGVNWILFFSGILVLIITLFIAILHLVNVEDWQLRWMLLYLIPAGLLLFGAIARDAEFQNRILAVAKQGPIPSLIPGTPADYTGAVISHFISMTYPLLARALSIGIEYILVRSGRFYK